MDQPTENSPTKMDQSIENTTIPIEDILEQIPTAINDVQVKSEPDTLSPVNSLAKDTNLEVCIPTCKPNQELRAAYIASRKVRNQSWAQNDLPEEPEEKSLDETHLKAPSDDEQLSGDNQQSSGEDGQSLSGYDQPLSDADPSHSEDDQSFGEDNRSFGDDDQSSTDEKSDPSSGSESDLNPIDSPPKPTERRSDKSSKAKISLALGETVEGLMTSNILSSANADGNGTDVQQFVPVSRKRDKKKALAEEIDKLPVADQAQAKKDAAGLIKDSKKFKRPASIVDMHWKIRGVKTLLKHHQLKAAAWMRDREQSKKEPNGGLLCDEMGLGKTLTALTIVAHEKFPPRSNAPTLIIVPRSLVSQWMGQISLHCVKKISNDVLEHYSGSRTGQREVVKVMQKKRIVLTTYQEVCSSHPKLKPPVKIKTPEELEAWREEEFNRRAGPLHKVKWHRIIIDEAHSIKNKDSATSIAVRALQGKCKWALSGTPLHNGVEELYPYLHFIYTTERMGYESFLKRFSTGLNHILKTVLHRSTYSTRILGKPIVTLPGISNRVVEVELCPAEKLLYREIQDLGIAMIDGLASTKKEMFVSHPLLAQRFLETVLNQRVIEELKTMAQHGKQDAAKTPSNTIINLLLTVADKVAARPRPPGDFHVLRDMYHKHILHIRENGEKEYSNYQEHLRRICPCCRSMVWEPKPYVVTSCRHVYCQGCFDKLPDQDGKTDSITRICNFCNEPIEEAGYSEGSAKTSPKKSPKKRKQSTPKKKGKEIFETTKRRRNSFKNQVLLRDISDDEWDDPDDDESDWVSRIGDRMPSAKTVAVRDIVANWVNEDENTKIVIFVQFLKTVKLLQFMCDKEGWKYALITGKVSPAARDDQIEKFGNEKDIKVLISSLRIGGVGLNLTMANKCILVDPWWNEAIQHQAYCRLYRIGQHRAVEYVQVIVKGSIDTWMISLQKKKTKNIRQLLSADSLQEILRPSGDVREKPNGGFSISTSKENKHLQAWTQVVESGVLDDVDSSEED
ncbi:uncharacterized protein N7500_000242 [Penicillium coprophilum]|uniref:uncharacterized protein n=1 Tax=Penicillium coprophilum TaxID=36646 RepID=UPI00238BB455|nr:uncharacterized protein N7500_000242 [Penicillium coprophilum]KAJ5177543.1 hypothetical protein N7500_000242 [Penicillium coprophilum]